MLLKSNLWFLVKSNQKKVNAFVTLCATGKAAELLIFEILTDNLATRLIECQSACYKLNF